MGSGPNMVYIVPTRGRPENARRLIEAWRETGAQARLHFAVDRDDEKVDEYRELFATAFGQLAPVVTGNSGPRLRLVGTLNSEARRMAKRYRWVGFMGDDHLPTEPGWDSHLARILSDTEGRHGAAIAYGNDGIHGENLPTAVVMSGNIIGWLGYMVPPALVHMFADNYWRDLGTGVGILRYASDVHIKHMHPIANLAPWDERYRETNAHMDTDAEAYAAFVNSGGLATDIDRVKELARRYLQR